MMLWWFTLSLWYYDYHVNMIQSIVIMIRKWSHTQNKTNISIPISHDYCPSTSIQKLLWFPAAVNGSKELKLQEKQDETSWPFSFWRLERQSREHGERRHHCWSTNKCNLSLRHKYEKREHLASEILLFTLRLHLPLSLVQDFIHQHQNCQTHKFLC